MNRSRDISSELSGVIWMRGVRALMARFLSYTYSLGSECRCKVVDRLAVALV
jgi:hypothetical protein